MSAKLSISVMKFNGYQSDGFFDEMFGADGQPRAQAAGLPGEQGEGGGR